MNRRGFIKSTILLSSSSVFINSCSGSSTHQSSKSFVNGFIISDAHIGWKGSDQPTLNEQKQAINTIRARFPHLDLFFDTGDLHHGYLNENERNEARDFWLTHLVDPFSDSFFSYVPGNHELGKGPNDEEQTATKIGSQNFRPYYSFDYHGIHFVSLPQLLDTILITQESLNWLEHDLYLNRHKTTLIFSHNSIKGTTYDNGETGYRVVVNSDKLLNIINKFDNVIAWLHGHNHQYEIVEKHNRLYVSNGRIGGFSPPTSWGHFGQGHLGGIYFEIHKHGLIIRCFSATENKFLDELGYLNLAKTLKTNTSFDSLAQCNYYCGHGLLTNNVKHKMQNHYLSNEKPHISTKTLATNIINENHDFEFPTELYFANKKINRLIGYQVSPGSVEVKATENGLELSNLKKGRFKINIPTLKVKKGMAKRGSYYRCESGDVFILTLDTAEIKTANLKVKLVIFNKEQSILHQTVVTEGQIIKTGEFKVSFSIPEIDHAYEKYLRVSLNFDNVPEKMMLNKLVLNKQGNSKGSSHLYLDSKQFPSQEKLAAITTGVKPKEIKYIGEKPVSTVIKFLDVKWQIRNAISEFVDDTIHVKEWSHNYQKNKTVVLTPIGQNHQIYLNKAIDLMPFRVSYHDSMIKIQSEKVTSSTILVFKVLTSVKKIIGADNIQRQGHFLMVIPSSRTLEVHF